MSRAGPWDFVTENAREIGYVALGYAGFRWWQGQPLIPSGSLPEWWELGAVAVVAGAMTALFASGALDGLFPDERGVFLQVVNARRTDKIETWELTEDKWSEIEVVGGQLNHLPENKHRAYECIAYDPERNVAVASWRESKPASEIVGHTSVADAIGEMEEIRSDLEPEARFSSILRRRLPSIVRKLDRQRAMDQNRALEPHMTPTLDDGKTVDEILTATLDEDALPPRLQNSEDGEGEVAEERDPMENAQRGLDLLSELGKPRDEKGAKVEVEPTGGDS
jgi:hypothetical protein